MKQLYFLKYIGGHPIRREEKTNGGTDDTGLRCGMSSEHTPRDGDFQR